MILSGEFGLWQITLPLAVGIAPLVAAGLISGAGALVKGVGGMLSGKAKRKREEERARLAYEAATKTWDQRDATRIALLKSLQNQGGARGPKVQALLQGLDPSMFESRPYTGQEIGQESGSSTLGGILGAVGGAAQAYGDYKTQAAGAASREAEQTKFLCAAYPNLPICQPLDGTIPANADIGGYIGDVGGN